MARRVVNIVAILLLVVLSLSVLGNSMIKPVGRDEHMYCTGGVLMSQGKMIYRDFSYAAQLPYHPLLYSTVFRAFETSHYLLAGRLVSVVCDVLVMVCILGIYRRIFGPFGVSGVLLGMAGVVLYLFNPSVDYANGYAWNHDVVILCVVMAFLLFLRIDFEGSVQVCRIAAIGALLTFASCMRITTVLVEAVFLAVLLTGREKPFKKRCNRALPFLFAAGAVLIWPVWVISHAPRAFYLNLVRIPRLYGQWLRGTGLVFGKLQLTLASLSEPGYLALIVIAGFLVVMIVLVRERLNVIDGRNFALGWLLVATFFAIALIPPTMWPQYLAVPVPFLVIALAYPLLHLRILGGGNKPQGYFKAACVVMGACALVAVASNGIVLEKAVMITAPELWVPTKVHEDSLDIARRTKEPQRVLTLGPLYALEGGCDIYPELSAGSIIYRIGDYLTAEERDVTHTVGTETVKQIVVGAVPSAVILAVETGRLAFIEEPLMDIAQRDWTSKLYDSGLVVYFRK